jgi:hypothetical protein
MRNFAKLSEEEHQELFATVAGEMKFPIAICFAFNMMSICSSGGLNLGCSL